MSNFLGVALLFFVCLRATITVYLVQGCKMNALTDALKTSSSAVAKRPRVLRVIEDHSRSFEMTLLSRAYVSPYQYSIETVSVSRTVSEIFSIKECRDLETGARCPSRSLKMAAFVRSQTTDYWSAILQVQLSLCCTVFELFSRNSRQRDWASRIDDVHLFVRLFFCLSVCRQNAKKTRFSQKLSNLELWSLLTTYRKLCELNWAF